ncbi:MAG: response regulator [Pelagimonas sp.]
MFKRIGLGGKLGLAFLVIAGLPAIAGLLALTDLLVLSRRQSEVLKQTTPAIVTVRGMAEESTRIVAIAPELAEVSTQAAREQRAEFLETQVEALSQRLERLDQDNAFDAAEIRASVETVSKAVSQLDVLVQQRISQANTLTEKLSVNLETAENLVDMADTLVANAEMSTTAVVTSLYGLEGETNVQTDPTETLDKLIEVDLFQLAQMFELRSRSAEIGLLINRIANARHERELQEVRDSLVSRLPIVSRRIEAIRDPGRQAQAKSLLAQLSSVVNGRNDLFQLRSNLLKSDLSILRLKSELQNAALLLGDQVAAVSDQAQFAVVETGDAISKSISKAQQRNALAAAVGFLLSIAMLWFFVRGHVVRRLDHVSDAMNTLASGNLDRQVPTGGQDEIARMEEAVEVFRQQAIANRELEIERDRSALELLEHRNNLQRMVDDQTEMLRREVTAHEHARHEAEAADRAKSEFLAMMSHEIRTPMNGVLGMLRSLSDDTLTPIQTDRLRAALASGQNLLKILNGILDYSKLESTSLTSEDVAFSVRDLVSDIVVLMRPSADEKGLHLWLDVPKNLPSAVRGDVAKLRQILFNLLSNAVKFTDDGEVILRVRGEDSGANRYSVTFEVSDTGNGISPAAKQRVFAAFEQEGPETMRRFGGTGLGLTISKRFADVIGARLSVESAKNIGSVFSLALTLDKCDPAELPPEADQFQLALADVALTILVVEDNEINQMVAQGYLERMGHTCMCVSTAEEAIDQLQFKPFDLVLMDFNLPGMSGPDAIRLIRASDRPELAQIPILGISAHVQDDQIESHLAIGMNGFVAKPVSPVRLSKALNSIKEGRRGDIYFSARQSGHFTTLEENVANALAQNERDLGKDQAVLLAEMFRSSLAPLVEDLRFAETPAVRKSIAHKAKSAAGNFGVHHMIELLSDIEKSAAHPKDYNEKVGALSMMVKELEQVLQHATATLERPI